MEHPSLFWRLGVIYVEFGVWLWGIAPACFIAWLLAKRKVILTNAIPGKQIAFLSLGVGSVLTLVFWMTMAVVLLPGAEIGEGVAFYFLNSLMSPLIFMAGTGVGLAYNVVRLRARLEDNCRLKAFVLAGLLVVGSVGIVVAAWPFFADLFQIVRMNLVA